MIITTNVDDSTLYGFCMPSIWGTSMLPEFRNALMDVLQGCISYDEPKESVKSVSLYFVSDIIKELDKDIDNLSKEGERK